MSMVRNWARLSSSPRWEVSIIATSGPRHSREPGEPPFADGVFGKDRSQPPHARPVLRALAQYAGQLFVFFAFANVVLQSD